jgi:hypothetical protein
LHCLCCGLVHVPPSQFLSVELEKRRYDLHQNGPDEVGYRAFLGRLVEAMVGFLAPGSIGLDFGSGPIPTLSRIFEQAGYSMTIFDTFYAPHRNVFDRQYDFITASEVVEHLREPRAELDRLWACLGSGGSLGIMTRLVIRREDFPRWCYKNDPTHIRFYSAKTFGWLAARWTAGLQFAARDVVIFRKSENL